MEKYIYNPMFYVLSYAICMRSAQPLNQDPTVGQTSKVNITIEIM